MSTRALVALRNPNGTFESIYVHHDGMPEWLGTALHKHYPNSIAARRLLEGGDVSSVDRESGIADYYHRDRGEHLADCRSRASKSLVDLKQLAARCWAMNLYIYDGEWRHMRLNNS